MNTTQLKYFIAVYDEKNITAAAKRCFISQPSISNAIKDLEDELETPLFIRHKKGVDITEEAHYLYPLALRICNDITKLPELFQKRKKLIPITLSIFPNLSPSHLTTFLQDIKTVNENLKLTLVSENTLADGKITLDVFKKEDEIFIPLWEEDYQLCSNKSHPLVNAKEVTPKNLHNFDFIECSCCEAHQQTIGLLACDGFNLNVMSTTEDKSQVAYLIKAGYGISFLPEGILESNPDLVTIPFKGPRMFRRIGLCYPANKTLTPALVKILKILY
ncbi:MAG TPA: LysR family transcriptional regulator [Victivallales bacterium]|nr:LysR family transcriptional regulator [Victivallales bacterium]